MIYTVTFNPAIDYVVQVDDFSNGVVNRSTYEEIFYGGKGINVSIVLKDLNIDSVALGFVAGATGIALENGLKESCIKTDFIWLEEGMTRINIKIKSEVETEINGQGPTIPSEALDNFYYKLNRICDGDILILAGSIPTTMPDDSYEKIIKRIEGKQVKVIVDATNNLLLNVLKYHPFLIKPNNYELGELFGVVIKTKDQIIYYAKELQKKGARNVLVSMGKEGAILIDESGNDYIIGVPKGIVQNSVGAGDSMLAGFITGYLEWGNYEMALKLGTAAGSATAFSKGLGSNELIQQLFDEMNYEKDTIV